MAATICSIVSSSTPAADSAARVSAPRSGTPSVISASISPKSTGYRMAFASRLPSSTVLSRSRDLTCSSSQTSSVS
jgi:hypothetical protein